MLTALMGNDLELLRHDVGDARLELSAGRAALRNRDAQRGLLDALEKYSFALAAAGLPVPYRVRDDLVLYRAIVTGPGGFVPGGSRNSVAVAHDDEHRLRTINRAIECPEAARTGLIETGHRDWE